LLVLLHQVADLFPFSSAHLDPVLLGLRESLLKLLLLLVDFLGLHFEHLVLPLLSLLHLPQSFVHYLQLLLLTLFLLLLVDLHCMLHQFMSHLSPLCGSLLQ
jgi:hypothetical protein